MKNRRWEFVACLVVVVVFVLFVWPTVFRYHEAGQYLVRENRFTGELAVFGATPEGRFAWTKTVAR